MPSRTLFVISFAAAVAAILVTSYLRENSFTYRKYFD